MLTPNARIVLDTLIPSNAHPKLRRGIFDAGFDAWYREEFSHAVFSMKLGFWAALFIAIWVAPLLIGKLPPISLYKRETRERALNALYTSKVYVFRQMLLLLKATLTFCYGADPEVRKAIGAPVIAEPAKEAI
jgi:hypothetical protein